MAIRILSSENIDGALTIGGALTGATAGFSGSITASGNSNSFGNTSVAALSASTGTFSASITAAGNTNSFGTTTFSGNQVTIDPASGDAILQLQSSTQTLRIDQNSIRTGTSNNLALFTDGNSNQLVLKQSNGGVGIGTASPTSKLHIAKTTTWGEMSNPIINIQNNGTGGNINTAHNMGSITWKSGSVSTAEIKAVRNTPASGDNVELRFSTSSAGVQGERMTINNVGNVGIGVVNPETSRLLVRGSTNDSTSQIFQAANFGGASKYVIRADGDNKWYKSDNSISMVLSQLGNVGIGTTGPLSKLELGPNGSLGANTVNKKVTLNVDGGYATTGVGSTGQYKVIGFVGTTRDVTDITGQTSGEKLKNFYLGTIGFDYFNGNRFSFWQGGAERLTIQGYGASAGNVGIGTTSPSEILQTNKNSAGNIVGGYFTNSQANTGAESVSLAFGLNRSGGDFVRQVKAISFGAEQQWTGTPSTVDGFLSFATIRNETVTERMRITSAGAIEVRNGSIICGEVKNSGADNDFTLNGQRNQIVFQIAGTTKMVLDPNQLYPEVDNTMKLGLAGQRWSIVYAVSGVNTSDETLKENIKECDLGIDFIDSLKPKSYNLKDLKEDNDAYGKKRYGLIAQDILQTELKDSVFGEKDGEYGLSYNDLIAPMIKAIQELKAEIELLKNK